MILKFEGATLLDLLVQVNDFNIAINKLSAPTPAEAPMPLAAAAYAEAGGAAAGAALNKDIVAAANPAATLPVPAPRKKREPKASPAAPSSPAPLPAAAVPPAPQGQGNDVPAAGSSATDWLVPPVAVVPAAPAVPAFPTVDEVRYVLGEVNGKFGMAAATQLLKDGGFERVSTIPEDKRAAFIATCKAKVATAA